MINKKAEISKSVISPCRVVFMNNSSGGQPTLLETRSSSSPQVVDIGQRQVRVNNCFGWLYVGIGRFANETRPHEWFCSKKRLLLIQAFSFSRPAIVGLSPND